MVPPDAQVPKDIDVGALTLNSVEPLSIVEGSGCLPEGEGCGEASRGIPVVVRGTNIAADASVTVSGDTFGEIAVTPIVGIGADVLAFRLAVPVNTSLAAGASETLTVRVVQGGEFEETVELELQGLDEWVASQGSPTNGAELAARYSRIVVDADTILTGSVPVRLVATAELLVQSTLDASASAADSKIAGPGGCDGGAVGTTGGCGGGGAGSNGGGGAGGGFAETGEAGGGGSNSAVGGTAGPVRNQDLLIPFSESGGGGGGGSASTLVGGTGGAGGGSAGMIELTSGGILRLSGSVVARGGAGKNGSNGIGGCGGGGGGGSGGGLLVRASQQVAVSGSIDLRGGSGASGPCNPGGDGSDGRVRVDVPAASGVSVGSNVGSSARAGVLDPALPAVIDSSYAQDTAADAPRIRVFGQPLNDVSLRRIGADAVTGQIGGDGSAEIQVQLEAGINTLCVVVDAANATRSEAVNCLDVAYIP